MIRSMNLKVSLSLIAAIALILNAAPARAKDTIHWKFTPKENLYYQLETGESRNLDLRGKKSVEVLRRTYWFRWEVESVDSHGNARIHVTFQRIRAETETADGKITLDTQAPPLGERERTSAAVALQEEVVRMRRSSFVFRASPHGGIPRPLPNVPGTIYMPERFTTAQLLAFVDRPMDVGGEWTVATADAEPRYLRLGQTAFRVAGSVVMKGIPCWKIQGVTQYDQSSDVPGVQIGSEPATGTHYFDNAKGRLVYSEQACHYWTISEESGKVQTDLNLKYTLLPGGSPPVRTVASRELADGATIEIEYENGAPIEAHGEWARVLSSNGSLDLQRRHRIEGPPQQQFIFVMRLKTDHIKAISIYDVTVSPVVRVARLDDISEGQFEPELRTEPFKLTDPAVDWLRTDEVTERIFKIVLENDRGQKESLYQSVVLPTGAIRDYLISKRLFSAR